MSSQNYTGFNPDQIVTAINNRYFYGLRRTDEGELFLGKADQMRTNDVIVINRPGDPNDNYDNFQEGQDFLEGRNIYHEKTVENLAYEQYRWDNKDIFYYVNDDGELVIKVNEKHTYDDRSSSIGNSY